MSVNELYSKEKDINTVFTEIVEIDSQIRIKLYNYYMKNYDKEQVIDLFRNTQEHQLEEKKDIMQKFVEDNTINKEENVKIYNQLIENYEAALQEGILNNIELQDVLDKVLEYEYFIAEVYFKSALEKAINSKLKEMKSHNEYMELYEKTLQEKPWEKCGCTICKDIGIEVVIFRGNNRNRRRGFHNTYLFYNRLKEMREKIEQ